MCPELVGVFRLSGFKLQRSVLTTLILFDCDVTMDTSESVHMSSRTGMLRVSVSESPTGYVMDDVCSFNIKHKLWPSN